MCKYSDIETIELPNSKTVKEVNDAVRVEVERIYFESWMRGVSVPFSTKMEPSIWPIPMAAKTK